ncbi:hypothetical protein NA78x_005462 [Anatilimnocola sp. NA78]|uniref:hypothetical protein n=1 Tax=Anatilimnocola sp. NA78 TaxID=3415683 RepID=UPI003CE57EC2
MKRIATSVCLFAASFSAVASAQELVPFAPPSAPMPAQIPHDVPQPLNAASPSDRHEADVSLPGLPSSQMSPGMYLYMHEQKRYDDPKQAVRRKAELKTAQRMQRLAAQKWYGVSNARPMASAQPFMDLYSPRWVGNGYNAFDYSDVGNASPTVLRIETQNVQR